MIAMQRFLLIAALVSGLLLIAGSCKDMGSDVPPPPPPLRIADRSFHLIPGEIVTTKVSGGTLPYLLDSRGDTNIVRPVITGDSLTLKAVQVGTSTIIVRDHSIPKLIDTVRVTIKEFAIAQTLFDLRVGESDTTTISGGTRPYQVVSNSDATKAHATIIDTTLTIDALSLGNTIIVVGDSHIPQRKDTVSVAVVVSFSAQIQPIFNVNCAVPGCHVSGGSGPMSLVAGASYGNLVGAAATRGPCAGDKRVQPSNADASALIKRLDGTCGSQMPLGGSPLPLAQRQLIRDWINQGARNN